MKVSDVLIFFCLISLIAYQSFSSISMVEAGNALRTEAILHVIHQEISPDI
ncbi:hypothetical protein YC2023_062732 [Brassica napus]